MRLRAKNILFLLLTAVYGLTYGQNPKFEHYNDKAEELKYDDFVNAKLYADSALKLGLQLNDNTLIARAYNIECNVYSTHAKYKECMEFLDKADVYAKKSGDKFVLAAIYNNRGICFERTGKFSKSIEMHLKALAIRQELKNKKHIAASYQNIGAVYFYMGKYDQCEINTKKALELTEESNKKLLGELYDNLGSCYFSMYKDSIAEQYMQKSLALAIETNSKMGIENAYNNLASFYVETGKPLLAKSYLFKAMQNLVSSPERVTSIMQTMARVYEKTNKPDSAEYYYTTALKLAKDNGNTYRVKNIYFDLGKFYFSQKDFENAYVSQVEFHRLDDSLTNEANIKNIAELEVIYKTEKQGKEIELLNAENKIQKESSENKKKLLWVSLAGLVLAIFAAAAFYRNFIRKKRDNLVLHEKNIEIEKQKDLIAEKNKEIVDSLNYAKRLQEAILPSVELIHKKIPQSFILYKPKDIVAGDFYWMFTNGKSNTTLIAVADCTGHGVPGALVSVVCANALNTAVKEFGLTEPAKILDKVNELVEETFGKNASEVKDGMDISLAKIEPINDHPDNKLPKGKLVIPKGQSLSEYIEANKKFNIEWAGANNPLWLIKDGVWEEIKADKQPVGKFEYRKPFTNHSLQLKVNDSLFLISDGYADQFGGVHGKKIKNKALKEFLFKNASLSSQEQKEILDKEFISWKGHFEQVDDVTIMGIKF